MAADFQPFDDRRRSRLTGPMFWIPMAITQAYLTISVLIFAFGPWPWPVKNPVLLYGFVVTAQVLLFVGYCSARNAQASAYRLPFTMSSLLSISMAFNAVFLVPQFIVRSGDARLSISEIRENIGIGVTDPAAVYKRKIEAIASGGDASYTLLSTLVVSPILTLMLPLGVVLWGELSNRRRTMLLALIVADLCTWFASGSNKGIADLVLTLPFLFLARSSVSVSRRLFTVWVARASVIVLLGSGLFAFFTAGQIGRGGDSVGNLYDHGAGIYADRTHPLLRYLPDELKVGVASLCSYISQGYYGLSLCIEDEFVWTYGVGHAYFTASWATKVAPLSTIQYDNYPARAEARTGWSYLGRWHTIYPWLASDITFVGALIFMFMMGRLFARAWQDSVTSQNPFALGLLSLLVIMMFYIPANNQVLGFPRTAIAFWVLLVLWAVSRRRVKRLNIMPAAPGRFPLPQNTSE